jgi:hypothetical protein
LVVYVETELVSLQCLSPREIPFLHHSGPSSRNLFLPGYQVHTSLLSVWGMASSSETDVARVKLLLTVAERWGSLCSTGLTGVDMAASGDVVKRGGQGKRSARGLCRYRIRR